MPDTRVEKLDRALRGGGVMTVADPFPYDRDVHTQVLIYHWRKDIQSCACGWGEVGRSHAQHVADEYEQAVATLRVMTVADDLSDVSPPGRAVAWLALPLTTSDLAAVAGALDRAYGPDLRVRQSATGMWLVRGEGDDRG